MDEQTMQAIREIREAFEDMVNELRDAIMAETERLKPVITALEKAAEEANMMKDAEAPDYVKSAKALAKMHEPDYPEDVRLPVGEHELHLYTDFDGTHIGILIEAGTNEKILVYKETSK